MVISKVGKRKRKDIPPPAKEIRVVQELPKRPKVHAQRKFAQVCGGSVTSTLPANLISNQSTQNASTKVDGQSHDPPQELLPNRRPNTEDFLTFLCFRGTSVLPSHLDFFNTNKAVEQPLAKQPTGNGEASCSVNPVKQEEKPPIAKPGTPEQPKEKEKTPPPFIPFAVRKRADTVAIGSRKQMVQALKKKYQDQRIAKNQAQCKTRSAAAKETETSNMGKSKEIAIDLRNGKSDATVNNSSASPRSKRKLRGNSTFHTEVKETIVKKSQKTLKESNVRSQKNSDSGNEKKSNGNMKVSARATKSNTTTPTKNQQKDEEEPELSTRTTRHRSYSLPKTDSKMSKTPDIITTVTESAAKSIKKFGKKSNTNSKSLLEEEFSSDDDLPLVEKKVIKNTQQTKPQRNLKRTSNQRNRSLEASERDASTDRKSDGDSKVSEPAPKRKLPINEKTHPQNVANNKKAVDSKKNVQKANESGKSEIESQEETNKVAKKSTRKRRNEFADMSQADQSENETKTGRPMRKTKEAATIYMELIGQKLNLSDFDDENFSMDSFPELPNVKKTEQMENELRANVGKEKRESMPTQKRNKSKKEDNSPFLGETADTKASIVKKCADTSMQDERPSDNEAVKSEKTEMPITQAEEETSILEKSFSDSDDEPLATKFDRQPKSPMKQKKSFDVSVKTDLISENNTEIKVESTFLKNLDISIDNKITEVNAQSTHIKPSSTMDSRSKNVPHVEAITKEKCKTPKSIDLTETDFKMPAESVKQLLSPPINVSPIKTGIRDSPSNKIKPSTLTKESLSTPSGKNSPQSISAILADLMPSKEESGKIFGIASVTLAQSSGPNDTKCTLGKCGSIHKPPLGPVVPTESYFGDQLTSKERRKAKVNMTHEQIQKWLAECSLNAEALEGDSLDDEFDLTSPPKPINYLSTPSPFRDRDINKEGSPTTLKPKTQTSRDILPTTPKAASSKQKLDSILKEQSESKETDASKDESNLVKNVLDKSVAAKNVTATSEETDNSATNALSVGNQANVAKPTPEIEKQQIHLEQTSASKDQTNLTLATKNPPLESLSTGNLTVSTPDKKPIYNRRTPVYNTKKVEQINLKKSSVVNTFGAFSPENEASIYSFDKEEDTIPAPASIPFRRHSRKGSTHSRNDESDKNTKKVVTPSSKSIKSQPTKKQQASLALNLEGDSKPAAIAVQTIQTADDKNKSKKHSNDENNTVKSTPALENDGKDSESEGHTFYIPLQCMGTAGGTSDQLIQGVAVKLGTEGPEGPNQKVIMHAKLVTKSQMGTNTTPIPEGMANVHEIVKSLIANKDVVGSKSVQIGTVQPQFKPSEGVKNSAAASTSVTPQQDPNQALASNLTRQSSNQSLFSAKTKAARRTKIDQVIQPSNNTAFPRYDDPAQMVEAPVFKPTEKEFQDPIEFINRIAPVAARYGLCRIIPPANFKPECKISDDMRFTAYNQYVHKMLHRWGPSVKEMNAIKKYLATQSITLIQPPLIGGMEVDLPRLYHTVQESGGLKEVIEKKKWARVAEEMCIPKAAQDRVTKLDDIYCKYLLPYDTLSPNERQKLFDEVEADWAKSEAKARRNADRSGLSDSNTNENSDDDEQSDEDDDDESGDNGSMECIVKGKSMALSAFFRVARNTMALWFRNSEPTSSEIEAEFWRHVAVRDSHVCVHSGSIDSSGWGYGFPSPGPKTKNSTCSKHPWNLKVLTNNHNSILRSIGPVTGVTVPTLHVGMLFSACCWYRDPHGLPWIEYLHTGGSKIWYSVPNEQSANFRSAFTSLVPTHCQNKTVWLPCDTAMVPPHMLTDRGVSLCRTEQEPGQFVIVFPRAYTSNICTGYSISESVYFAPTTWLDTAKEDFKDIHDSCEPAMFSLEQLLFSVASDARTNIETLETVLPMLNEVYERESKEREEIKAAGVIRSEKITSKPKKPQTEENECDICRANLYISWIKTDDDGIFCLQHAIKYLNNDRIQAKQCQLLYMYKKEDIEEMIKKINEKLLQQKKKPEAKK